MKSSSEPLHEQPRSPHNRERSLTALVVLAAIELFVMAPLAGTISVPIVLQGTVIVAIVIAVLSVVWASRTAVIAVLVAVTLELLASALRIAEPSRQTEVLDFTAALILFSALTVVLGIAVFGPGRVTIHRILGAVAIYLNVAAIFALAYRIIVGLQPAAFASKGMDIGHHTLSTLVYFSFTTLTTSSFGDIVPVAPFARAAANLEAVIGQLFPATLLARLIILELETRKGE